jgi:hypothetical protein
MSPKISIKLPKSSTLGLFKVNFGSIFSAEIAPERRIFAQSGHTALNQPVQLAIRDGSLAKK